MVITKVFDKKILHKNNAARKKSKSVEELSQTNGQVEKTKPTTLDQIWGDDGTSRYGAIEEHEYKHQIDGMNRTDLQMHAAKMGLMPVDNRDQLTKRLMREFRKYRNQYIAPPQTNDVAGTDIPENVLKILREGR